MRKQESYPLCTTASHAGNIDTIKAEIEQLKAEIEQLKGEIQLWRDLLAEVVGWLVPIIVIDEATLVRVAKDRSATNPPEFLEIFERLRQLDTSGRTGELWKALLASESDALVSLGLIIRSAQTQQPAIAAIGVQPLSDRKSCKKGEANAILLKLAERDPEFPKLTAPQMAERVSQETGKNCSDRLIGKTPFWDATMNATGRRRRSRIRSKPRRSPNNSPELVDVLAEHRREAEADLSPLDPKPKRVFASSDV